MIGFLSGKILEKSTATVLLDVRDVGYDVEIPLSTCCLLPSEGNEVKLWIHTHVREDSLRLFGFATKFDKMVFETLITVSSVGPKSALGLLGPLNGIELCDCILSGDTTTLVSIPGVGQKTAERIVLELKSKVQKLVSLNEGGAVSTARAGAVREKNIASSGQHKVIEDLRSALTNMGYKEKQVIEALRDVEERGRAGEELVIEVVLKDVLRKFSGRMFV